MKVNNKGVWVNGEVKTINEFIESLTYTNIKEEVEDAINTSFNLAAKQQVLVIIDKDTLMQLDIIRYVKNYLTKNQKDLSAYALGFESYNQCYWQDVCSHLKVRGVFLAAAVDGFLNEMERGTVRMLVEEDDTGDEYEVRVAV